MTNNMRCAMQALLTFQRIKSDDRLETNRNDFWLIVDGIQMNKLHLCITRSVDL